MSKYTSEQYSKVFWKLPVELRDIVTSYSTTEHINIIGKKHNLQIDKVGELVDITFDVIMGIVATKDFVRELQDALQITALEASVLARDIDENIFKPIKETMVHLYAGRAPYKPSSSLVEYYEEDDDHPELDRKVLLKEIEDPTPSEVKKEVVAVPIKIVPVAPVVEKPKVIESKPEAPHTDIIEYHKELKNEEMKKVETPKIPVVQNLKEIPVPPIKKPEPPIETPIISDKSKGDSILNQIASLKLNQAFVMPKGPEGIRELSKLESEQIKSTPSPIQKETPVTPTFTIPKPSTPTAPAPITTPQVSEAKIDPYRERI